MLVACLAALAACPGCKPNRKEVYPVRGRVLFNGKPTARALVTFHPVGESGNDAVHPSGEVDAQGNFTLTSYTTGDGAPEGEYQVTVVWWLAAKAPGAGDETYTRNYLPERYGQVRTSPLRVRVVPGENELPVFELKGK
jgi:hypothetical protein